MQDVLFIINTFIFTTASCQSECAVLHLRAGQPFDNNLQHSDRSFIQFSNDWYSQHLCILTVKDFISAPMWSSGHIFDPIPLCLQTPVLIASFQEDSLGLKMPRWNVNLNLPHAVGCHRSVKVLTVQVVKWNLLQWRHFQHYFDHEHIGF